MLFDRPSELPVATLRSRSWSNVPARVRGGLRARWRWLRPRTVPVIVALAGMFALLQSADYLSRLARRTPNPPVALDRVAALPADLDAPLTVDVNWRGELSIAGQPTDAGQPTGAVRPTPLTGVLQMSNGAYQIKLVPAEQPQR